MTTPVTEASNPFTEDIDVASPEDIVSLLEKCDQEIFDGHRDNKAMFCSDILQTIENVSSRIQEAIQRPEEGLVVFSGCGTSGRLGFIVARTFNEILIQDGKSPVFRYLLAGGDKALFTSQEANEDDPHEGAKSLQEVSINKKTVVYIGITCGLSAPYVAGQLDYCMDNLEVFTPVLLGFNPTQLARNTKIELWDKTFSAVVDRMRSLITKGNQCYILNPVVGPEPITGSSRMKGGTATKLLLETMCMKAYIGAFYPDRQWSVSNYLNTYRLVSQTVYSQKSKIGNIIQMAGNSLSDNGNIYYLGTDSLALMGLIDASECPPTYGASLDDVRGFVKDGYHTLRNNEGDLSDLASHFRISLEDFVRDVTLTEKDTVIFLNTGTNRSVHVTLGYLTGKDRNKVSFWNEETDSIAQEKVAKSSCRKVLITFSKTELTGYDVVLQIDLPTNKLVALTDPETAQLSNQMYREIAVKWCLNAVTTGAHILKGKVYKNIMIDVKVSNNKLFHRAAGILQKLGNLTLEESTEYLLRSIYNTDVISSEVKHAPVGKHIVVATPKEKVVPVALVSAVLKCSIEEAKTKLAEERIIRRSIVNALANVKTS